MKVKEITKLYSFKMEEILEFRAFTQFSYLQFNEAVDKGFKVTTVIGPTKRMFDQNEIKQRLEDYKNGFLPQLSFQHAVSVFESWFFDILSYLLRDKNRLNKKRKVDVADLVSSSTIEDVIEKVVEAELNEVRYKKTNEWFQYLFSFVNIDVPSPEDISKISEIKASRDVLVHNECIAIKIYCAKAGELARGSNGDALSFDNDYIFESWNILHNTINSVGHAVSKKLDV